MVKSIKDIAVTSKARLRTLKERERGYYDLQFIKTMAPEYRNACFDWMHHSRGQLRQDLFALTCSKFKSGGFFVEFGATNGVELNNTYLLETEFGWSGILAEPAHKWQPDLKRNRNCAIDCNCVWKESGAKLQFTETPRGENSGITKYVKHSRRLRGTSYEVNTISLNDLLITHQAPEVIDYMSVDTEGSEFEILKRLNFNRWRFEALSIEHNYTPQREDVHSLLIANGYKRIYENISQFDDWYVPANFP